MILIGGMQENQAVKTDGICTCLAAAMGMGGGYVPVIVQEDEKEPVKTVFEPIRVFELRCDEGIRLWNDDVVGTLRTIEACGDKYVIGKME